LGYVRLGCDKDIGFMGKLPAFHDASNVRREGACMSGK